MRRKTESEKHEAVFAVVRAQHSDGHITCTISVTPAFNAPLNAQDTSMKRH
jgi:hypothetical protein